MNVTIYLPSFLVFHIFAVVILLDPVKRYDSIPGNLISTKTLTCDFGCPLYLQVSPFRSHCHYPLLHLIPPHCHQNADLSLQTLKDLSNENEPQAIKYTQPQPTQGQLTSTEHCLQITIIRYSYTIYMINLVVSGMQPLPKHYCFHNTCPKMFFTKSLFPRNFFPMHFSSLRKITPKRNRKICQ